MEKRVMGVNTVCKKHEMVQNRHVWLQVRGGSCSCSLIAMVICFEQTRLKDALPN